MKTSLANFPEEVHLRFIQEYISGVVKKDKADKIKERSSAIAESRSNDKPIVIVPENMSGAELRKLKKQARQVAPNVSVVERPEKPPKKKITRTAPSTNIELARHLLASDVCQEGVTAIFTRMYRETKGITGKEFIKKRIKIYMDIARKEMEEI